MTEKFASQKVKSARIEATIIRADGSREPLGVIAEYRSGPIHLVTQFLRDLVRRLAS